MYGAILGDIAGSRFEFSRPEGFDWRTVDLFGGMSRYTDDTVLTIATKYAVLKGIPYAKAYGMFGRKYLHVGYGNMFLNWLYAHSEKGYNSYGNGSAMRVSFIGDYFSTLEEAEAQAEESSICTHNHPEGVKAARATAAAVFLARQGESKQKIAAYLHKTYGYTVGKPLVLYRPLGKFDVTARGTMPLAIRCFLESDDWESCIRNVFSVRCDTDTVACIAGGIADAFYGGTGLDEKEMLRRFLVMPNEQGVFDTFLYDWAMRDPVKAIREEREEEAHDPDNLSI